MSVERIVKQSSIMFEKCKKKLIDKIRSIGALSGIFWVGLWVRTYQEKEREHL